MIDENVLLALALKNNGGGGNNVPNPNLLDNPWFTVNQRGKSSYIGNTVYTVDRWVLSGGSLAINVNSDGISLVPNTGITGNRQLQNRTGLSSEITGKTVTLSIMFTDGNIEYVTGVASTSVSISKLLSDNKSSILLYYHPTNLNYYFILQISDDTALNNIRAVKLELGSVSTLALDTAPNYATELLKCQRYFKRLKTSSSTTFAMIGSGIALSATNAFMLVSLPSMRTEPTITMNGTVYLWDDGHQGASGFQSTALNSASCMGSIVANMAQLSFQTSGLTAGKAMIAQFRDKTSYIDFSADL